MLRLLFACAVAVAGISGVALVDQDDDGRPESRRAAPRTVDLERTIGVDADEVPLVDFLRMLSDLGEIKFHVSQKDLDDVGVPIDTPISLSVGEVRLATALDLVLEDLELDYYVRDDIVVISSRGDVEQRLVRAIYDVRHLLAAARGGESQGIMLPGGMSPGGPDMAMGMMGGPMAFGAIGGPGGEPRPSPARQLMNLVTNTVAPESWHEVGGPGSISEFAGILVVLQTDRAQREVSELLDGLRDQFQDAP